MATAIHVREKSKWKNVEIDPNFFGNESFEGFVSIQELTDYELIKSPQNSEENHQNIKKSKKKEKLRLDTKETYHEADTKEGQTNKKKKRKKLKKAKSLSNKDESECEVSNPPSENQDKSKQNTFSNKKVKKLQQKKKESDDIDIVHDIITDEVLEHKSKEKRKNIEDGIHKNKKQKVEQKDDANHDSSKHATSGCHTSKDMAGWKDLFVPPEVLRALADQGFTAPTPIQALALPSAIRDRRDIVGAAETGSGKTLSFGIPIIHHILAYKRHMEQKASQEQECSDTDVEEDEYDPESSDMEDEDRVEDEDKASNSCDDDSEEEEEEEEQLQEESQDQDDSNIESESEEDLKELEDDQLGCVRVINDVDLADIKKKSNKPAKKHSGQLLALILAPTRELAIQVRDHLTAAAKYTDIKIASVVGGMASQKQERLLKKSPEIVVATPGRLWELIQDGEPHLSTVHDLRHLVIDEADRMVEKGHFEELLKLLELINADEAKLKKRQNYVFSATLTMVHSGPQRILHKKKKFKMNQKQKIESLTSQIGVKEKPKIIDLTRKSGTAETLTEARINCTMEEKDIYLYYFMVQHPGRTLVFANSKDCIRRLVSIFTLLQCCPLPLHADMHQRQRLKNLDKFKGNPRGLLLATDVAARGLDIPNVEHVIHYQVPRTTENYVHRSGRTARASKDGLSVMLVGPDDVKNYKKIVHTLNRDHDLPLFPTEHEILPGIKARISLARQIDTEEHRSSRMKKQNNWFIKAAEDMDIELDEDQLLNDLGDSREQASQRGKVKHLRTELAMMIKRDLISKGFSGKYPTKSGKLVMPYRASETVDAVMRIKDMQSKKLAPTNSKDNSTALTKKSRKMRRKRNKLKAKVNT